MKVLVAGLLVVLAGCGSSDLSVEGRLVDFDGDLTTVRSFELISTDGEQLRFIPDVDATFHGGPISHLRDHLVSGEPIIVFYEERGGDLVATSVEDG